jgi:hypothetical protein
MAAYRRIFEQAALRLLADCGPPFEPWEQRRRGKKVAQAFPVSRLRTNLFGPEPAQRMCGR